MHSWDFLVTLTNTRVQSVKNEKEMSSPNRQSAQLKDINIVFFPNYIFFSVLFAVYCFTHLNHEQRWWFFSSDHHKSLTFKHAAYFAYGEVFVKCHSCCGKCEKRSTAQSQTEWQRYIIHSLSQKHFMMIIFICKRAFNGWEGTDESNKPVY